VTTTVREPEKLASTLMPGDWIYIGGNPIEVQAVTPISGGTMVTYRHGGAPRVGDFPSDAKVPLVLDTKVDKIKQAAERAKFIAGLHRFADWLKANPWAPIRDDGAYVHPARLQINLRDADMATIAQVREIADRLGAKADESLFDRTDASMEIGSISYSVIAWHRDGRPAEPEAEREGPWFEVGDEVYPWPAGGRVLKVIQVAVIEGSSPARQQFIGDEDKIWRHSETYRSVGRKPDADPTGLNYTRADDEADEPTTGTDRAREVLAVAPVSPARVPLHYGVVDDEDAAIEAADDAEARRSGGTFVGHYLNGAS
jgi:hypothetical protein